MRIGALVTLLYLSCSACSDTFAPLDIDAIPATFDDRVAFVDRASKRIFALPIGSQPSDVTTCDLGATPVGMKTVAGSSGSQLLVLTKDALSGSCALVLPRIDKDNGKCAPIEQRRFFACYDSIDAAPDGAIVALGSGKQIKCASGLDDAGCRPSIGETLLPSEAGEADAEVDDAGPRSSSTPLAIALRLQENGNDRFVVREFVVPLPPPLSVSFVTPPSSWGMVGRGRWVLASSSGQLFLAEIVADDGEHFAVRPRLIDLKFGSFAPNKLLFDANGTRAIAWAPRWRDAVIIDLVDDNGQPSEPRLSRVSLGRPARDAVVIASLAGELLVVLTDPPDKVTSPAPDAQSPPTDAGTIEAGVPEGPAMVVAVDLGSRAQKRFALPFNANVVSRLAGTDDSTAAIFWQSSPDRGGNTFAMSTARALQRGLDDSLVKVTFSSPYRWITPLDVDTLVIEKLDGSADLFRASDGLTTSLGKTFSLLYRETGTGSRLFSQIPGEATPARLDIYNSMGEHQTRLDLPAPVTTVLEVDRDGRKAHVLVHPSTLGSITALMRDTNGDTFGYSQRGFLKAAIGRSK